MKPLEEYMLFTKPETGSENTTVINSQGIRSAQCNAYFDIPERLTAEPVHNISLVILFSNNSIINFLNLNFRIIYKVQSNLQCYDI